MPISVGHHHLVQASYVVATRIFEEKRKYAVKEAGYPGQAEKGAKP